MVCFTYTIVNTLQKGGDDDDDNDDDNNTNNKCIVSYCILHCFFFFLLFSSLKGNLYFDLRHDPSQLVPLRDATKVHRSKPVSATYRHYLST